ncbi:MAG: F0F1 ATP synthase subunit alpha [Oscillospiraceae bacterium]|nr:F0F1 ATP synthase subunit alpha [Oscillospiraceae bacterium]
MNLSDFLKQKIEQFEPTPVVYAYGTVSRVGDGVVRVTGLPGRSYGELLAFDGGAFGMAIDLEEDGAGAVLLDTADVVSVGTRVRGTGRVCDVPVGENLVGRVIDPIGRALDGAPLEVKQYYPVERRAPDLVSRRAVDTPLETGVISVDSLVPIGRGQRELIIGDRQTGKTTLALDTILNQKGKDVICIYCAIGQKASTVSSVIETLRAEGAMQYSIVVAATASDSPALQYLSPYAACAVGEYFMEQGKDVLVVYDDLSKHAVAYRAMSLLLRRSPGREAYPGDIFYLHSRLLERAACLSHEKGGGTLTALPIIETKGGNISAYIPTNVISITDGQIYLESELFHNGIRPAVNTGLSVSRVGRAAQPQAMRNVSASLRIDLAQYREMAVFSRFGSDLEASTKKLLESGERLTNLLTQAKQLHYSLSEKTALLLAFKHGGFDDAEPKQMPSAAGALLQKLHEACPEAMAHIDRSGDLSEDDKTALLTAAGCAV